MEHSFPNNSKHAILGQKAYNSPRTFGTAQTQTDNTTVSHDRGGGYDDPSHSLFYGKFLGKLEEILHDGDKKLLGNSKSAAESPAYKYDAIISAKKSWKNHVNHMYAIAQKASKGLDYESASKRERELQEVCIYLY